MKSVLLILGLSVCVTSLSFAQEYMADTNTVALWHFNELNGSIAADSSGNGYDAVVSGTSVVDGQFSKARYFSSVADTVRVNRQPFKLSEFTAEAWVYLDTLPDVSFFIVSNLHSGVDKGYFLTINGNKVLFTVGSGVGSDHHLFSNSTVPLRRWFHVAGTFDGSVMRVFLNGAEDASAPWTQLSYEADTTYPMMIGNYNLNPWDPPNQVSIGRIDEVRISKKARSADEFNVPTLLHGLVAYYPFDSNANDESGNSNHGVVNGPVLSDDRFGNANRSYHFDGIDDFIEVANSPYNNLPGDFTLAAWISPDAGYGSGSGIYGNENHIISKWGTTGVGNSAYALGVTTTGNPNVYTHDGAVISGFIPSIVISTNRWHHVVGQLRGADLLLYVDGVLIDSIENARSPQVSSYNLVFGRVSAGLLAYFKGSIDDARLYNRALSKLEIGSLYHEGGWPPLPKYIIASAGPHGSIFPADTVAVDSGGTQKFTFTPELGYGIDSVLIDGFPALPAPSYTFPSVAENHAIRVVFRKLWDRAGLTVSQSIHSRSLTFGLRQGAAYGIWGVDPSASAIDSSEGELEVPPVVEGVFDARFTNPSGSLDYFGQGSWVDIRNFANMNQTDSFRVHFQRANNLNPVVIRWSSENIADQYTGPVTIGGTLGTAIDMKMTDSLVITNTLVTDVSVVATRPNLPVIFETGWNLVSLPLDVEDGHVSVLFPGVSNVPFSFDAVLGYQVASEMVPGQGYWLKFPFAIQSQEYSGLERPSQAVNVSAGWNLLGSLTNPIPVGSIASEPPGILTGQFYGFNRGYYVASMLEPRRAYWVKVSEAGQLLMSTSGPSLPGKIVIQPDGELPPPPPGGASLPQTVMPTEYSLNQNYPNPFNPVTTIRYAMPSDGIVQIRVFNVLGQEVAVLADAYQEAGVHAVLWDASSAPSGVYFYRLQAGSFGETKKLLLMK